MTLFELSTFDIWSGFFDGCVDGYVIERVTNGDDATTPLSEELDDEIEFEENEKDDESDENELECDDIIGAATGM